MMKIVGKYEILEELARGSCGVVYKALDTEIGRTVAIKMLREGPAGPVTRERFVREAKMAAGLLAKSISLIHIKL